MAPSPTTIPTSFVPQQPVRTTTNFRKSGGNPFLAVSILILVVALLACGAVFGYQHYLEGVRTAKQAQVQQAQASIDSAQLSTFIRARDRFSAAEGLLDGHVAVSNFLGLLESLTLTNVRFTSLSFTLADDRSAEIKMDGTARTFNSLAVESSAFAAEKRVKRAIFSGIKVNQNGTVAFSLDANLEPELLAFTADGLAPATPLATTTPTEAGTSTSSALPIASSSAPSL